MRIVIKVGSNILTRSDGKPNATNLSALVDQIAAIRALGHQVILVSSGAVACGRGAFTPSRQLDSVAARQLYSSIGQIHLINLYNQLFASYGITVGQVLTQKENFSSRTSYLNQRACMLTMLEHGVLPIVNENDTASLTELMFTDNDELSGLIAAMLDADTLVILSNVDGIYTGSPFDPDSSLIPEVASGRDLSEYVVAAKSGFGRGGMGTKCGIARKVSDEGITVIIARGDRPGVLVDLLQSPDTVPPHRVSPLASASEQHQAMDSPQFIICQGHNPCQPGAARVLLSDKAVSLLPVGITSVEGEWEEGDIVNILAPDGSAIGVGRVSLSSSDTLAAMGRHGHRPVIHYDYLYNFES